MFLRNAISTSAIGEWLQAREELASYAENREFIDKLSTVTDGLPLYLKFLIQDLVQALQEGQNLQKILTNTPDGFNRYVEQQIDCLDEIDLPEKPWQLFALLAAAKGSLTANDVKALTHMNGKDLRALRHHWQVTRWLQISGERYTFTHPLLGITFANLLEDETAGAKDKLLDYCCRWQEHESVYALRYYPQYLYEAKQWEKLYAIARDSHFAATQQKKLPSEPNLPLETIQKALKVAVERDDAVAIAEFMLSRTTQAIELRGQESPLDALRNGSIKRAFLLADLYDIKLWTLWYLLLAWELKDAGKENEALKTLQCLSSKQLTRFSSRKIDREWQGEYAAYILSHIFELEEEICNVLQKRFLNNQQRRSLSENLSGIGKFDLAILVAREMDSEGQKWRALVDVAERKAISEGFKSANKIFQECKKILYQQIPNSTCVYHMASIAAIQKSVVHCEQEEECYQTTFREALKMARDIQDVVNRIQGFINVAFFEKQIGFKLESNYTLQSIDTDLEILVSDSSINSEIKCSVLRQLSELELGTNLTDKAVTHFEMAREIALSIQNEETRQRILLDLYRFQNCHQELMQLASKQSNQNSLQWKEIQQLDAQLSSLTSFDDEYFNPSSKPSRQENSWFTSEQQQLKAARVQSNSQTARHLLAQSISSSSKNKYSSIFLQIKPLLEIADLQITRKWIQAGQLTISMTENLNDKIESPIEQSYVLIYLIDFYHQLEYSTKVSHKMKSALETIDRIKDRDDIRLSLLGNVVIHLAKTGHLDRSLSILNNIPIPEILSEVIKRVTKFLQSKGDREKFMRYLEMMPERLNKEPLWTLLAWESQVLVFSAIASAKMFFGETESALELFSELCELAWKEPKPDRCLSSIAIAQVEIGEIDLAWETIAQIKDGWEKIKALKAIAIHYLDRNDPNSLLKTLNEATMAKEIIADSDRQIQATQIIALLQAMTGQGEQAMRIVEEMADDRDTLVANLANVFVKTNAIDDFKQLIVHSTYNLNTAYQLCACLARVYSDRVSEIARFVSYPKITRSIQ